MWDAPHFPGGVDGCAAVGVLLVDPLILPYPHPHTCHAGGDGPIEGLGAGAVRAGRVQGGRPPRLLRRCELPRVCLYHLCLWSVRRPSSLSGARPHPSIPTTHTHTPHNHHPLTITGLGPILLRDLPAFATYFALYEMAKDKLEGQGHPLWLSSCAAGGLAGVMSWVVVYPCDVIKSVVQTRPASTAHPPLGMWATGKELLRAHGPRVFFRGMSVALLRALPVNCIVFPVYEASVQALGKVDPAHRQEYRRLESLKAKQALVVGDGDEAVAGGAAGEEGRIPAG